MRRSSGQRLFQHSDGTERTEWNCWQDETGFRIPAHNSSDTNVCYVLMHTLSMKQRHRRPHRPLSLSIIQLIKRDLLIKFSLFVFSRLFIFASRSTTRSSFHKVGNQSSSQPASQPVQTGLKTSHSQWWLCWINIIGVQINAGIPCKCRLTQPLTDSSSFGGAQNASKAGWTEG